MRKIDTGRFHVATRSTARQVNRQIVLNLIREHQPISRAELARRMDVARGLLTLLVRDLLERGAIVEEASGARSHVPGRRPTLLRLARRPRLALAIDVRPGRTALELADLDGRVAARDAFDTPAEPAALVEALAVRARALLRTLGPRAAAAPADVCEGVGVVVPGMVDRRTGRVIYSPRLGWRHVELRAALAERLGLPVTVESAPIACAVARLWLSPEETHGLHSFAYASISDGVGVGLVVGGEPLRGHAHTAGEFGHVALDPAGPRCACGQRGCWEALVCNSATVARYAARAAAGGGAPAAATVEEVVALARAGDAAAAAALAETGAWIGRGLAAVVSVFNPGRIFVGGEITAAWPLLAAPIRRALAQGTLTEEAHATPVTPDASAAEYRLRGAVALVAGPNFAAPAVA